MFLVTEADADAIRAIFHQEGELSAAIELRRRFPAITDNAKARTYVRTIAGWKPLPSTPCSVTRLRPRGAESGRIPFAVRPRDPGDRTRQINREATALRDPSPERAQMAKTQLPAVVSPGTLTKHSNTNLPAPSW